MTYHMTKGLLWPSSDVAGPAIMLGGAADLEQVYPLCRGFDVAVQAGGHCGVWPRDLGVEFGAVYTFEPDPVNFHCLCANAPAQNVFKFNAALGDKRGLVDLDRRPANCGAHQVSGPGRIPVLMIDDLGLSSCDLIYLDIEGYELPALKGAHRTIQAFRPVIAVEDKGMSSRYGIEVGEVERWVCDSFCYRVALRPQRDVVMVPC